MVQQQSTQHAGRYVPSFHFARSGWSSMPAGVRILTQFEVRPPVRRVGTLGDDAFDPEFSRRLEKAHAVVGPSLASVA